MKIRGLVAVALAAAAMAPVASAHAQQGPARRTGLPNADQPVIRNWPQPTLSVEGGAGIVGFVGGAASLGPAWNVRVSGAVSDRFVLEGNYVGGLSERADTGDSLVMTALDAGGRYNILLPDQSPVVPFVGAGVGYAGFAGRYGDAATLIVPVNGGVERMLTENIKVGARFTFRPAFFDDLGTDLPGSRGQPGADTWSLLAQVGGGF
ncbi:hypothetical protein E8A73_004430 [Polyangium aurulentum]|nr:hypothetical protein E8A73_004430 [Polyangium aurulentum]